MDNKQAVQKKLDIGHLSFQEKCDYIDQLPKHHRNPLSPRSQALSSIFQAKDPFKLDVNEIPKKNGTNITIWAHNKGSHGEEHGFNKKSVVLRERTIDANGKESSSMSVQVGLEGKAFTWSFDMKQNGSPSPIKKDGKTIDQVGEGLEIDGAPGIVAKARRPSKGNLYSYKKF